MMRRYDVGERSPENQQRPPSRLITSLNRGVHQRHAGNFRTESQIKLDLRISLRAGDIQKVLWMWHCKFGIF
jgi:hypothetical protein